MFKKADYVLIFIIAVSSLLCIFLSSQKMYKSGEKYIEVKVDGKIIENINFNDEGVVSTYPIRSKYGYNILEVNGKKIRVIEASCPNKIDVKKGYISNVGETLVCVPNRMIVTIRGETEKNNVDIMVR